MTTCLSTRQNSTLATATGPGLRRHATGAALAHIGIIKARYLADNGSTRIRLPPNTSCPTSTITRTRIHLHTSCSTSAIAAGILVLNTSDGKSAPASNGNHQNLTFHSVLLRLLFCHFF
jgi:hypothetical protein